MSEPTAPPADETAAALKAWLVRTEELLSSARGADPLVVLAQRLPQSARYAHGFLSPLEAFGEALVRDRVYPRVPQSLGSPPPFADLVRDHAIALGGGRYRLEVSYARHCLGLVAGARVAGESTARLEDVRSFVAEVARETSGDETRTQAIKLRLLAATDAPAALALLDKRFADADDRYDLGACRALCEAVRQRPFALAEPDDERALQNAVAERESYLAMRAAQVPALYRTGRYFRRDDQHAVLESFVQAGPRALHIHAKGGMGKTLLLRWLAARHCATWAQRIPVAVIDLDEVPPGERVAERLAFRFAEVLDPQLRPPGSGSQFGSLVESFRNQLSGEFVNLFCSALADAARFHSRPILLVVDTTELLVQDEARTQPLFEALAAVELPQLRVLTAGRYALSDKSPALWAALRQPPEIALRRFEPAEAVAFVSRNCGIADADLAAAVATKVDDGLPFKLVLVAELALAEHKRPDEIAAIESVDLAYLILRVVSRLEPVLQWVVRYGVVLRLLTRESFEAVIAPHVRREIAGMEVKDQTERGLAAYRDVGVFRRHVPTSGDLWEMLQRYASAASWVEWDQGNPEALHFQTEVREPMRRLLWNQDVTPLIHLEAALYFEARAHAAASGSAWAGAITEHFYHRFHAEQSDRPQLAAAFVTTMREAIDRAPREARAILDVAIRDALGVNPEVVPTRGGTPWLEKDAAAAATVYAIDANRAASRLDPGLAIPPEQLDAALERCMIALGEAPAEGPTGEALSRARLIRDETFFGRLATLRGAPPEIMRLFKSSVASRRRLAAAHPAAFARDLAEALSNYSLVLGEAGGWEDALAAAEEGAHLFEGLAGATDDALARDFCTALTNLAKALTELGRRWEARAVTERVLAIQRGLLEAKPDENGPGLARTLSNYAFLLGQFGEADQALVAIDESVQLYTRYADQNPREVLPMFAAALVNRLKLLGDKGRWEEVFLAADAPVSLYRRLQQESGGGFAPELARALANLAMARCMVGQFADALAPAREAVEIQRTMAVVNRAGALPGLASALGNLARALADSGELQPALDAAEEAVVIARELSEENPAAFSADLARTIATVEMLQRAVARTEPGEPATGDVLALEGVWGAPAPSNVAPVPILPRDEASPTSGAPDLEVRLRRVLLQRVFDDPDRAPGRGFQLQLRELLDAAIAGTPRRAVPSPESRRLVAKIGPEYLNELLGDDRPLDVLKEWSRIGEALGTPPLDRETWIPVAEACVLVGEPPPPSGEPTSDALFRARSRLVLGDLDAVVKLELPGEESPLYGLAVSTLAEGLARRCAFDELDELIARLARRGDAAGVPTAVAAIWAARASLHLVGHVSRAESYLRAASDVKPAQNLDVVVERYVLAIAVGVRGRRKCEEEHAGLARLGAQGRRRHGLAASVAASETGHEAVRALDIAPPVYERRLRSLYDGGVFGAAEAARLRSSPLYETSAVRARELEAEVARTGWARKAGVLEKARDLYESLRDDLNAARVEEFRRQAESKAAARSRKLVSSAGQSSSRAPVTGRVAVTPELGRAHERLAKASLASSGTIQKLSDGSLMIELWRELGAELHAPLQTVILNIAPRLAALPYELVGSPRASVVRGRRSSRSIADGRFVSHKGVALIEEAESAGSGKEEFQRTSPLRLAYAARGLRTRGQSRLESVAQVDAQLLHIVTRFGQRGETPFLIGSEWTPTRLARQLGEATPRIVVLHAAAESGLANAWRALLLRNAFAAELFEMTDVPVLVAVGPLIDGLEEPVEPLTNGISDLLDGRMAPRELAYKLRRRSRTGELGVATVALFCDDPDRSLPSYPGQ